MLRATTLTSSSAPESWPDALMRIASRATAGTGTGLPMVKVRSAYQVKLPKFRSSS
jgi:hypothetical protein